MPGLALREHQVEANARIRQWVGLPARSAVLCRGAGRVGVLNGGRGRRSPLCRRHWICSGRAGSWSWSPTLDLPVQTAQA